MASVAIVYHSVTGSTAKLANAIASGVGKAGVDAIELEIVSADIQNGRYQNEQLLARIDQADALIMGSPTFMGSVSAQFKAFADATSDLWTEQRWADKLAAGFTIGSNSSGDQLSTLQYLSVLAAQHGMLWVGIDIAGGCDSAGLNRLGAQSGLVACSGDGQLDPIDLQTAQYLGSRVARLAIRMRAGSDAER